MVNPAPQSPDQMVKDLPLLTLIREAQRRADQVRPMLERRPAAPTPGSLDCRVAVSNLVAQGLDAAAKRGVDRFAISADIGRLMGTGSVSKARLDKIAAPSQEGFDLKAHELPAYTLATKDEGLIRYLAAQCGLHVVTDEDMALVELGRLTQANSEVQRTQAQLLEAITRAAK
ncbi:MAG: hypothetical protein LDL07_06195 [Desulfarculus sp.]|nr:hypothetical protein [Desulfarculus sp.]